jgi:hypothetical protein
MASSEELLVLAATYRAISAARRVVETYAGRSSPVRTDQISALLVSLDCHLEVFPFRSDTVAMTLPRCAGVYTILINRSAERTDRVFAIRHEIAHVVAGECDEAVFLADEGYMSSSERVADLFALSDLVPGWWIETLRRGHTPWRDVREEVVLAISEYAEDWCAERLHDRATLRLAMFRMHAT